MNKEDMEYLYKFQESFISINDRMSNIEGWIKVLEKDFLDYAEKNPKGTDQWIEQRLRALEHQVKELKELI